MDIKKLANTYLLLALVLGALLPVVLGTIKNVNLYEYLFLTYLISVPSSLAFVILRGKKEKLASYLRNKRDLAIIASIGLLNYAFLEFGLSYAERFVSASLATVVYRTYPVLMLLFIPFVLKERITKYQAAALTLAFAGLLIAISGGTLQFISNAANPQIIALLIIVALAGALATTLVKRFVYDMESSMFIFNLANFVFFSALFFIKGMPISALTAGNALALLYVGIIYNVLVGFMYYGALRMLKTTFVTNIYFLSPFITLIFASALLGEAIQPYYVAVAVLVAIGIVIQKFDRLGGTYDARSSRDDSNDRSRLLIFDVTGAFADTGEVAIIDAIRSGGRVLAVKLPDEHVGHAESLSRSGNYSSMLTDKNVARQESKFVKEIVGAHDGETVILKAGKEEEGDRFFSDLSMMLNRDDVIAS